MKTFSRSQLEQAIVDAPLLRKLVTETDGQETAILTHIANLDEAAEFARSQSVLPPIAVVDWDGHSSPRMESWLKGHSDFHIQPWADKACLPDREFCLSGRFWGGPFSIHFHQAGMRLQGGRQAAMIDPGLHSYLSRWWRRPGMPEHIVPRMHEIHAIYNALADNDSKSLFIGIVKSLQTGDPGYIPVSDYFHYFNPMADFSDGSIVFEGGAADGSYTVEVAKKIGKSGKIICFEPLQKFARLLKEKTENLGNISVEAFALSDRNSDCFLEPNGELSHLRAQPSPMGQQCQTIAIDAYIEEHDIPCHAIKLDIEGSEMACLKGARKTIAKYHPLLLISVYHHAADNFDIPLWLMDNFPSYELRLGHHSIWHHETVLYAKWGNKV